MKKFHVINIETINMALMSELVLTPNQYQIIIYIVLKSGKKIYGFIPSLPYSTRRLDTEIWGPKLVSSNFVGKSIF